MFIKMEKPENKHFTPALTEKSVQEEVFCTDVLVTVH